MGKEPDGKQKRRKGRVFPGEYTTNKRTYSEDDVTILGPKVKCDKGL